MRRLVFIMCLIIVTSIAFSNEKKVNEENILITQINKIHAGWLLLGTTTTIFNVCAVTNVALLADLLSVSSIILSGTLTGISVVFMLGTLISGSVLLSSGIKRYRNSQIYLEKIQSFITRKMEKLKRSAIISGVICSGGGLMTLTGVGLICSSVINPNCGILGNIFTFIGSICMFSALPVMITSLAMSAWLKGQANRLSVDIGITSGSTGELLGDKRRNVLEKPNGVALALSVKF